MVVQRREIASSIRDRMKIYDAEMERQKRKHSDGSPPSTLAHTKSPMVQRRSSGGRFAHRSAARARDDDDSRIPTRKAAPGSAGGAPRGALRTTQPRATSDDQPQKLRAADRVSGDVSDRENQLVGESERQLQPVAASATSGQLGRRAAPAADTNSFLDDKSKVTGIRDVLSRMDASNAGTASSDDAARSLLNKFLGAQVMMTGMESMMAQSASRQTVMTAGTGRTPTVSTRAQRSQFRTSRDEDGQWRSQASVTSSALQTPPAGEAVVVCGVNIADVTDQDKLHEMLEQCDNFDERKKIRARLMVLMQEAKARREQAQRRRLQHQQQRDGGSVSQHGECPAGAGASAEPGLLPLVYHQLHSSLQRDGAVAAGGADSGTESGDELPAGELSQFMDGLQTSLSGAELAPPPRLVSDVVDALAKLKASLSAGPAAAAVSPETADIQRLVGGVSRPGQLVMLIDRLHMSLQPLTSAAVASTTAASTATTSTAIPIAAPIATAGRAGCSGSGDADETAGLEPRPPPTGRVPLRRQRRPHTVGITREEFSEIRRSLDAAEALRTQEARAAAGGPPLLPPPPPPAESAPWRLGRRMSAGLPAAAAALYTARSRPFSRHTSEEYRRRSVTSSDVFRPPTQWAAVVSESSRPPVPPPIKTTLPGPTVQAIGPPPPVLALGAPPLMQAIGPPPVVQALGAPPPVQAIGPPQPTYAIGPPLPAQTPPQPPQQRSAAGSRLPPAAAGSRRAMRYVRRADRPHTIGSTAEHAAAVRAALAACRAGQTAEHAGSAEDVPAVVDGPAPPAGPRRPGPHALRRQASVDEGGASDMTQPMSATVHESGRQFAATAASRVHRVGDEDPVQSMVETRPKETEVPAGPRPVGSRSSLASFLTKQMTKEYLEDSTRVSKEQVIGSRLYSHQMARQDSSEPSDIPASSLQTAEEDEASDAAPAPPEPGLLRPDAGQRRALFFCGSMPSAECPPKVPACADWSPYDAPAAAEPVTPPPSRQMSLECSEPHRPAPKLASLPRQSTIELGGMPAAGSGRLPWARSGSAAAERPAAGRLPWARGPRLEKADSVSGGRPPAEPIQAERPPWQRRQASLPPDPARSSGDALQAGANWWQRGQVTPAQQQTSVTRQQMVCTQRRTPAAAAATHHQEAPPMAQSPQQSPDTTHQFVPQQKQHIVPQLQQTQQFVSQPQPAQQTQQFVSQPAQQTQQFVPQPAQQTQQFVSQPAQQMQQFVPQPAQQTQQFVPQPAQQTQQFVTQPAQQTQQFVPQPAQQTQQFVSQAQPIQQTQKLIPEPHPTQQFAPQSQLTQQTQHLAFHPQAAEQTQQLLSQSQPMVSTHHQHQLVVHQTRYSAPLPSSQPAPRPAVQLTRSLPGGSLQQLAQSAQSAVQRAQTGRQDSQPAPAADRKAYQPPPLPRTRFSAAGEPTRASDPKAYQPPPLPRTRFSAAGEPTRVATRAPAGSLPCSPQLSRRVQRAGGGQEMHRSCSSDMVMQQRTGNDSSSDAKAALSASSVVTKTSTSKTVTSSQRSQLSKGKAPVSAFDKFKQLDSANPKPVQKTDSGSSDSGGFKLDAGLAAKAQGAKEMTLYWAQCRTRDYQNVKIENFSTSWNDGMAFCALIHHFYPDAFDFEKLNPKNRRYNFDLAFKTADEKAGIYPLLDTDDMVAMRKPDWKCVFTYVQAIYRRLKDGPVSP